MCAARECYMEALNWITAGGLNPLGQVAATLRAERGKGYRALAREMRADWRVTGNASDLTATLAEIDRRLEAGEELF